MRRFISLTLSKISLCLAICLAAGLPLCAFAKSEANMLQQRILTQLDSLIGRSTELSTARLANCVSLRQRLANAHSDDERYTLANLLFEEYKTFSMDSAMRYLSISGEIAERSANPRLIAETKIRRSFVLSAGGLLKEAAEAIAGINTSELDRQTRLDYYGQMVYLYSHLGNYSVQNDVLSEDYYNREKNYKDSITGIITPNDAEYDWYMGWNILGTNQEEAKANLIKRLEKKLKDSPLNSRTDAMDAYMLSRLLHETGDDELALTYMAASSIADIRSSNRDVASLEELAKAMFDRGDIVRAYNYLNEAIRASGLYPNRARMAGMLQTLDTISNAYRQRLESQEKRTHTYLIISIALSLALLILLIFLFRNIKALREKGKSLNEANTRLSENISELSQAKSLIEETNQRLHTLNERLKRSNDELSEANYVKEEYLGYVFSLCSNYIKKHEDFRKGIRVKLKAGKHAEIDKLTDTSAIAREHLKEFYHSFDSIFLNIYPTFIEDFNALLQPGEQIQPKNGELMNTELRIYALVRLGITDSVKIAEFLHCSPQTVYNTRFRVRSRSNIAKEDFVKFVKSLGRFEP